LRLLAGTAAAAAGVAAGVAATATASPTHSDFDASCGVEYETGQKFTNWSSTHSCAPARVYEPRSAQEVVRVLAMHHASKQKVRPVGQALSPNGIGMNGSGHLLSLAAIDYVEVDKQKRLVTVGAGATVSAILKELKKHGLTLQNFSSIQEQQIGGWTQVAAHGTGVTLPTVEEMIVSMNVATATEGLMTLSATSNPDLFQFAKVGLGPTVPCRRLPRLTRCTPPSSPACSDPFFLQVGLGCLGVVTEVTLQCVPCLHLLETTAALDRRHVDTKVHYLAPI